MYVYIWSGCSNIDLSVERILQYMKAAIISMYLHYKPIPEVPLLPNLHIDHAYDFDYDYDLLTFALFICSWKSPRELHKGRYLFLIWEKMNSSRELRSHFNLYLLHI